MLMQFITILVAIFALGGAIYGQSPATTNQSDSHGEMVHRGDQMMGFSAAKTTHHFLLFQDGGAIEVAANDPKDIESRNQIRMHLSHIASMFSEGNFNAPMLIHATTPPGVATMTKLHAEISFAYEETTSGARIRIKTQNAQALDALHAFLLFQIIEHQTGDSAAVAAAPQHKE
jgi:hypothetical protein